MPNIVCKSGQFRRIASSALGLLQQILRAGSLFITLEDQNSPTSDEDVEKQNIVEMHS